MRRITLEVPLRALAFVRRWQGRDVANARIETLGNALDNAALASGVASFEDNDDLKLVVLDPVLQLDQLTLEPKQLLEIDGPFDRLARFIGVPKLLELDFAELQFELLVEAVAEVGADKLAQGLVSGRIRIGYFVSSVRRSEIPAG